MIIKLDPFWYRRKTQFVATLLVDGFGYDIDDWEKIGSYPWLNVQDYPSSYIRAQYAGATSEWYTFQNLPADALTIESVTFKFLKMALVDVPTMYLYFHDGVSGYVIVKPLLGLPNEWATITHDVTSIFNTVAKVNAAKCGFGMTANWGGYLNIDKAWLEVLYKIV